MPTTVHPARRRRLLLTLLLVAGGGLAAMVLANRYAETRALADESASVRRQLELYAQALQQLVDRYRTLPEVLALDPELRDAVSRPLSPDDVVRLNGKLERANDITRSSTLTLIGPRGIALAASNWNNATSNVGVDFSFRPYVQQALARGRGNFYGIGLTTHEPGYFLSQALRDDAGKIIGVVVIKIALAALEREWVPMSDIVLASDAHGVVFLASRSEWRYRLLRPLEPQEQEELRATRQYSDLPLEPLQATRLQDTGNEGHLARLDSPPLPKPVLWQTLDLPEHGWQLHLLHGTGSSAAAGRNAAVAAAGAWLALSLLLLFVVQRRRLSALRLRSRAELEAVVEQHARELRSAQDGLLQAAQDAERGLSRSLAHLPQGVVIVDAQLCLVAWNARYAELFGFPADLLQVGRPIADLFRFNAQRGLLGPGPVDAAIQRRLEHLRSRQPHQRESEKRDGTVLDIRGNPLPDGGFVTSYSDITTYKKTARELRSLADALEHRIDERTRALALAKREAEDANRSKSRFVASAVHDLLQPLNAARMYISILLGRLGDGEDHRIADHVDQALVAQDQILASLLDISRLESGALQTQVADFALEPLLEALGRDAGMLAAARGLQLERVATRAVVRSDEALLRRILQNFLSNAIRYTPSGRLLLGCRRQGDGVRIEVHDQGPGIPEHMHEAIFEEFRRLDSGEANDRGAGLGLAIVDRIGRLLGHRVGVRSWPGRGSVFWVLVPRGDAANPPASVDVDTSSSPPEDDADAPLRGLHVWCVDDDPHVSNATALLLQRWHCRVGFAGGPQAALSAAEAGDPPALLLLDLRMGDIDGPDLYPLLCERWGRRPKVLLITAERDTSLRALAHEHGWGLLHKPVRASALRASMSQLLLRDAE